MFTKQEAAADLYKSLNLRRRPEDVAELILAFTEPAASSKAELPIPGSQQALCPCGCGEPYNVPWYSLMREDFVSPASISPSISAVKDVLNLDDRINGLDVPAIEAFLQKACAIIHKQDGSSFRTDRLTATQRREAGITLSRRQYDRAFRAIAHLEEKLTVLKRELTKVSLTKFSKSLLASELPASEFFKDDLTACFVAYYTARRNLRTTFTNQSQAKPMDKAASAMFDELLQSPTTNWWAVAHVYTVGKVLDHLTDEQKGQLLGLYWTKLRDCSDLLARTWVDPKRDRTKMTVRRGDDSSTWNMASRAFNMARVGWLNLLKGMNQLSILDELCPGKVQTLVAADVAYWHTLSDETGHADTKVWAALPYPWEVIKGSATCTKAMVEEACSKAGVDPIKEGWTTARTDGVIEEVVPTPELVHGISVSSPELAELLRRQHAFSGKGKRSGITFLDL